MSFLTNVNKCRFFSTLSLPHLTKRHKGKVETLQRVEDSTLSVKQKSTDNELTQMKKSLKRNLLCVNVTLWIHK